MNWSQSESAGDIQIRRNSIRTPNRRRRRHRTKLCRYGGAHTVSFSFSSSPVKCQLSDFLPLTNLRAYENLFAAFAIGLFEGAGSVPVPDSNCYALDNSSRLVDFVSSFYYSFLVALDRLKSKGVCFWVCVLWKCFL